MPDAIRTITRSRLARMVARVLAPGDGSVLLVCGPDWGTRCGAAGGRDTAFCAGHTVVVDRDTSEGKRTLRVSISPQQRTCPFGPPEPTRLH
ncbi:MAG: hypothetical protein KGN00_12445 [Chloroflexota bacterium]|nr:hypothetical protein [Chloroflexota bacterium]MDE3194483.1 hypothetical protein [Chloroflexota bacterium]